MSHAARAAKVEQHMRCKDASTASIARWCEATYHSRNLEPVNRPCARCKMPCSQALCGTQRGRFEVQTGRCNCRLPHLPPLSLGPVHGCEQLPPGRQRDEGVMLWYFLRSSAGKGPGKCWRSVAEDIDRSVCLLRLPCSSRWIVWAPQAPGGSAIQQAHQQTPILKQLRVDGRG